MPRLVKGGKKTYGWSIVGENGRIVIPPDAFEEYGFIEGEKVFLIPGSRKSGGFGLTSFRLLKDSPTATVLRNDKELAGFQIPEGKPVEIRSKTYNWLFIKNQSILLPVDTLKRYGIKKKHRLLTVSGSSLSLGFVVRGPIVVEAGNHPELPVY